MKDSQEQDQKRKQKQYEIRWRGRITRNVGTEYITAFSVVHARYEFERIHKTKQVTNVTFIKDV